MSETATGSDKPFASEDDVNELLHRLEEPTPELCRHMVSIRTSW